MATTPVNTVATIAALRAVSSTDYVTTQVCGHSVAGDGGDRMVYWNATSTATDDGALVIRPTSATGAGRFLTLVDNRLNVLWFGAVGDGVTDDSTAVYNGTVAAAALGIKLWFPPLKSYAIAVTLTTSAADQIAVWWEVDGTLLHQQQKTILTVTRAIGTAITLAGTNGTTSSGVGTSNNTGIFQRTLGSSYLTEIRDCLSVAPGVPATVAQGSVWLMSSNDFVPWTPTGGSQPWTGQLFQVQGIGLDYSGSSTGSFTVSSLVTGATSGAVGYIRALTDNNTTGSLIFATITGTFIANENLQISGVTKGQVVASPNAGVAGGADPAYLVSAERFYDFFATGPTIQLMAQIPFRLEGTGKIDIPAGQNSDDPTILAASRLPGFNLQGLYDPIIQGLTVENGWTRMFQLWGVWKGDIDIRVNKLPNDATTAVSAYGYGIDYSGCSDGTRIKVDGQNCRHVFTTNVTWSSSRSFITPWALGNPKHFLVHDSIGRNCFGDAFDNHWGCYFGTYADCVSLYDAALNRPTSGAWGFSNRSFGTTYNSCRAIGVSIGFIESNQDQIPPTNLPNVTTYKDCSADNYQLYGFFQAGAQLSNLNRVEYLNSRARGDGNGTTATAYQSGWKLNPGSQTTIEGCTSERFNGAPLQYSGTAGSVPGYLIIDDFTADYSECPNTSPTGLRFDSVPPTLIVGDYKVVSYSSTVPGGFIRNASGTALTVILSGKLVCQNSDALVLLTSSSTGTTTFVSRDVSNNRLPVSASIGDANVTYRMRSTTTPYSVVYYNTPITAQRKVTLDSTNACDGDTVRIVRGPSGTGAFNVIVVASTASTVTIATLSGANTYAVMTYVASLANWVQIG